MPAKGPISALAALLLGVSATAVAQELELRGTAGVPVYVVTDQGRVMLATIGEDGEVEIPLRLVDDDTELEVVLENLPTGRAIAFVERGERDPACQDASPTGSLCRYTGSVFTWGRLRRLTVTDAGEVIVEGAQEDRDDGLRWGVGWIAGGGVGRAIAGEDESLCREARAALGDISVSCDDDLRVATWSAEAGMTLGRFVALKVGYLDVGRFNFDLTGGANDVLVTAAGHVGRSRGPTFMGAVRLDLGWFVPYVEAGTWRWETESSASLSVSGVPSAVFVQSDSGWDPVYGGGIEIWPARYVGFDAAVRVTRVRTNNLFLGDLDKSFAIVLVGVKVGLR